MPNTLSKLRAVASEIFQNNPAAAKATQFVLAISSGLPTAIMWGAGFHPRAALPVVLANLGGIGLEYFYQRYRRFQDQKKSSEIKQNLSPVVPFNETFPSIATSATLGLGLTFLLVNYLNFASDQKRWAGKAEDIAERVYNRECLYTGRLDEEKTRFVHVTSEITNIRKYKTSIDYNVDIDFMDESGGHATKHRNEKNLRSGFEVSGRIQIITSTSFWFDTPPEIRKEDFLLSYQVEPRRSWAFDRKGFGIRFQGQGCDPVPLPAAG